MDSADFIIAYNEVGDLSQTDHSWAGLLYHWATLHLLQLPDIVLACILSYFC